MVTTTLVYHHIPSVCASLYPMQNQMLYGMEASAKLDYVCIIRESDLQRRSWSTRITRKTYASLLQGVLRVQIRLQITWANLLIFQITVVKATATIVNKRYRTSASEDALLISDKAPRVLLAIVDMASPDQALQVCNRD